MLSTAVPNPPAHAKSYPPSGATRWIACPASVNVVPLYPNAPTFASDKGDLAHYHLELGIVFGILPDTHDPDMDLNIRDALEWVSNRRAMYIKDYGECQVYAEQRYDIPQTGEFGTCDITFVTPAHIEVADYKNGFVLTDADEQMRTYLLGAISKFGARETYQTTVIQPNHNHRDGPFRTTNLSGKDMDDFALTVENAVLSNYFAAGSHCKKTYCPHRGSCITFLEWCETEAEDAYYPHEVNAIDDDRLSRALDHTDVLHGVRDEYRKEAMRRILQHNRRIAGYKVVKSRTQRDFAGEAGREACYLALIQLGYHADDLYEKKPFKVGELTLHEQTPLTVAGVERMVKQKCKYFGRGKWAQVWDEYFRPHIREFSGSLTLERETDGRPAHTRGSEFGSLIPAQTAHQVTQVV